MIRWAYFLTNGDCILSPLVDLYMKRRSLLRVLGIPVPIRPVCLNGIEFLKHFKNEENFSWQGPNVKKTPF